MTAARKLEPDGKRKRPAERPAGKRGRSASSDTARVRVLPNGKYVVLATDAGIRRKIVDAVREGPELRRLIADLRRTLALLVEERSGSRVTPKQMAARKRFYAEVLKHNDEPSDAQVDAFLRSWR
jgi:hypothetical protein